MPLQGNLRDFSTTQLLNLINLAGKTGTLSIFESIRSGEKDAIGAEKMVAGKERARVAFKMGKLISAILGGQDGNLVSVLNKAGKLSDEQARIIRERAKNTSDKALALLLINANYVTQKDIIQSVQTHTLDIIYDLMTWNKEPFIFQEEELPPPDRITVPLDLENVIMEGTRRKQDVEVLTRELPNLDFALRFPERPGDSDKFKGIQLSVEEWRVISFINPKNSIRQIAKACTMTDMEIRRVVYGLMNAGLVELVKPLPAPTDKKSGVRPKPGLTPPQRPVIEKLLNHIKSL